MRRFIGMVFQQPNPFATSIYNNVAFGLRLNGYKGDKTAKVEQALSGAALWDEVKDKLHKSGLSLSGGQQQRLCIARAIATEPEVLLMDEPCSALDPIATRKIEELMLELKKRYTIAIVTHNLQQAQRVADNTGFLYVDTTQGGRTGYLVEFGDSKQIFRGPAREAHAGLHSRASSASEVRDMNVRALAAAIALAVMLAGCAAPDREDADPTPPAGRRAPEGRGSYLSFAALSDCGSLRIKAGMATRSSSTTPSAAERASGASSERASSRNSWLTLAPATLR